MNSPAVKSLIVCRLVEDTAWHPVPKAEVENWAGPRAALFKIFLGSPLKLWASVGHWAIWHFNLNLYTEKQKPRVSLSEPGPRVCPRKVVVKGVHIMCEMRPITNHERKISHSALSQHFI